MPFLVIDAIEEKLLAQLRELPLKEQQLVLEFANSLVGQASSGKPASRSKYGVLKDEGIDVSFEDIQEIRREMWANFPRESAGDID